MEQDIDEKTLRNPKFAELTVKRSRLSWALTVMLLIIYYGFILTIAFAPSVLATPIVPGGVIAIGLPIGILIIIVAFALTGIYVWQANSRFDVLNQQIIEETQ